MRLSSIITIKKVLEEQIENTAKEIEVKGVELKVIDNINNKLIAEIQRFSKHKETLVKALADLEFTDWH